VSTTRRTTPRLYRDIIERMHVQSFLSVPLRSHSQLLGAIVAADKLSGGFGPEDRRVLEILATSAVIGLENARLYGADLASRALPERQAPKGKPA
jgi:GAF domain-containing protein